MKQTEITQKTKADVLIRQRGMSISGAWLGNNVNFHHVIGTGLGEKGVGYEWNVIALTPEEHRWVHDHQPIKVGNHVRYTYEEFITLMKNHLKINYPNWTEEKCKVHKGWEEKDYGIKKWDQRRKK